MSPIRAVYENGVFRPVEPVDLPEHCEVEVVPRSAELDQRQREAMEGIFEILSRRYSSGESDVAARHNEHQP